MMLIALTHETYYQYDKFIELSPHIIRLRPAPHCKIPIKSYSLTISPEKHYVNWQHDASGNQVAQINFLNPTNHFKVIVDLVVEKVSINPFDFFIHTDAINYPFEYCATTKQTLQPYLHHNYNDTIAHWYNLNQPRVTNSLNLLVAINRLIFESFKYKIRLDHGVQEPEETLKLGSGSCRDFAWFHCHLLRQLGFATRFVSGYLTQLVDHDENPNVHVDSLELHAWCEVFLPGAGWVGFDATSGLLAADNHIPLCVAAHPVGASAISGNIGLCHAHMTYDMQIDRISKIKRAKKYSFSEVTWQSITTVAQQIDSDLNEVGVDLTIGGEPTYVDQHNINDPQWKTEALGQQKFLLGQAVNADLQKIFAPNGIAILSQGKWYPGETLPRWAFHSFWRKDNQPLWLKQNLLEVNHNQLYQIDDAKRLIEEIAGYIHAPISLIKPIYEDILYQLWISGKLGANVNLDEINLTTHDQQQLIKQMYQDNLKVPSGYCLPIAWSIDKNCWLTCDLQTIGKRITALPGESSIAYRLPLDKLATHFLGELESNPDQSNFSENKLEDYLDLQMQAINSKSSVTKKFIRSICCIELKNNHLHVFLPPIKPLKAYCMLVNLIESAATQLNFNVQLEGYLPPSENQLTSFSVTPDPGVLEINIHPAKNWNALAKIYHQLDLVMHAHGLSATKFTLDGRRISSGGGCHMTLGASSPSKSLFLQQPRIIQSMLTFWQHHPSLSYLFSGIFVGPTSQAPRIDEARHDSLYELELAFKAMPKGRVENYWLIDRLLRHLLVDVTGNTHRAEFCVDKLFSPDSEMGRQGLIELRAFEMQADPQLNSLQSLLIRSLIALFHKRDYHQPFHRWGNELHDRFMLPYFIWQDFSKIIDYIKMQGYRFELDWFLPIYEFKFPVIGSITVDGIYIELRHALEPWPVLGEQNISGYTSRLVDSTLSRIQIRCIGINLQKNIVACNGVRVPLKPCGLNNEYIAGIRFKAHDFKECLHPNIPAIDQLTIDIVDLQSSRSIGGCKYYSQHPGGKNSNQLPINRREAETRQRARFTAFGHSPGIMNITETIAQPEHSYILDLRKYSN